MTVRQSSSSSSSSIIIIIIIIVGQIRVVSLATWRGSESSSRSTGKGPNESTRDTNQAIVSSPKDSCQATKQGIAMANLFHAHGGLFRSWDSYMVRSSRPVQATYTIRVRSIGLVSTSTVPRNLEASPHCPGTYGVQ